jgi:hypothetical protein
MSIPQGQAMRGVSRGPAAGRNAMRSGFVCSALSWTGLQDCGDREASRQPVKQNDPADPVHPVWRSVFSAASERCYGLSQAWRGCGKTLAALDNINVYAIVVGLTML